MAQMTLVALCLQAPPAWADAQPATERAGAALDFQIIIPPMLQVRQDSHPTVLQGNGDGELRAVQSLVLDSTMPRGFCMALSVPEALRPHWQVQQGGSASSALRLSQHNDGYQLCALKAGRYSVELEHRFTLGARTAPNWPVSSSLAAL